MTAIDSHIEARNDGSGDGAWIFAYFRQIYSHRVDLTADGVQLTQLAPQEFLVEALHLAYSDDGLHWTPLNDNQPILPAVARHERIRDPFIGRGVDGNFHLVATGGHERTHIAYVKSSDLIHWEDRRSLPVMEAVPGMRNAWAPEFIYDAEGDTYFLCWSSSSGSHGWDDSRIWCTRTRDFRAFSTPRVLFDPGFTVIDATIVQHGGRFYLFFKDERFGYRHGEHRNIRLAVSQQLDGPYELVTDVITPSITEGPAVIRVGPQRWHLLYDHCMDNCYGASVSSDLLHWQVVEETQFPPEARHGSVVRVTRAELSRLQTHFARERFES